MSFSDSQVTFAVGSGSNSTIVGSESNSTTLGSVKQCIEGFVENDQQYEGVEEVVVELSTEDAILDNNPSLTIIDSEDAQGRQVIPLSSIARSSYLTNFSCHNFQCFLVSFKVLNSSLKVVVTLR